ncbi:hypothetical protein [Methylorubrum extorquens]|uniref:hypothetical protein n=1 Tax=Methylorubrum extorquens TaxID=408 RepID=UPI00138A4533|nr:hypothetical protein [Methylorubrum extorquens]
MSAAAIVEESTIFSAGWAIARLPYAWEGHGAQSAGADGFRTCFVLNAQAHRHSLRTDEENVEAKPSVVITRDDADR